MVIFCIFLPETDPFITIALFVTDYGLFLFPLILFDKHTTLFFDFEVHIFGTLTFSDIAKLMYFELLKLRVFK